ncbi:hypothetical protein CSA56_15615 [candidate division KSB3 bacterium]|uniref:Type 4 fimbrial biogenesis protein PilX N-terminal domain-containing protein n=1 Tax=candidate division KSB3 bacterium TaxID=2044937 RepID=A0A2G6K9T8_9BACT|nr:MAG: hypothetical protein CSA56_15615 [candidate division KSB3 bacterium]
MVNNQRGNALLLVVITFAVFLALLGVALERGSTFFKTVQQEALEEVALNFAEAGVEFALDKIVSSSGDVWGEYAREFAAGNLSTSISYRTASGTIEIYSEGIAKDIGKSGSVHKALRVILSYDRNVPENAPVMLSREEVL